MADDQKPELTPAQLRDIARLNQETAAKQALHEAWLREQREQAKKETPAK